MHYSIALRSRISKALHPCQIMRNFLGKKFFLVLQRRRMTYMYCVSFKVSQLLLIKLRQ